MDSLIAVKLLALLIATNGAPILAKRLLEGRFELPLDLGLRFVDGRPLLGPHKTLRGIAVALLTAWIGALALGLPAQVGWWIGACAMLGDLVSSFTKRRLGIAPSDRALGLDQVPEALLPLWAVRAQYALGVWDIAVLVGAFFVLELALSQLLYALHIRKTPY
jgi:CDP-2,3-bis-(O-geranylgeranyl)-sn-glycerol synthase